MTPLLLYLFFKDTTATCVYTSLLSTQFLSFSFIGPKLRSVGSLIQFFFVHRTTISKDLSRLVRHLSAGLLTAIAFFAVYLRLTDLVYPSQLTSIRTVEPSIPVSFSAEYFRYVLESLPFLPNDFGYIESNWLGQTVSSAVFICIFFAVTFAGLAYESRQIFGTFGRSI